MLPEPALGHGDFIGLRYDDALAQHADRLAGAGRRGPARHLNRLRKAAGFTAIVFRIGDDVYIQSRDLKPLDRYFPELHAAFLERLPSGVVVDGEIVMPTKHGLDFGGLQMRLHPAASRVEKLAKAAPAAFVAFDLLAIGRKSLLNVPQQERRLHLEKLFKKIRRPLHLTPLPRHPNLSQA